MSIRSRMRQAFTLVELLVVIGIIAVLVGVLLPALQKAQDAGKAIACASQMRQIGMAMQMYVNDWKGTYPPCWIQDDKAVTPPNSYVGEVGKNRSYVTLLLKYVGFPARTILTRGAMPSSSPVPTTRWSAQAGWEGPHCHTQCHQVGDPTISSTGSATTDFKTHLPPARR